MKSQAITTLEQIKEKAIPVLKQAGVLRSSIFGSVARGDNTAKSDIDILVEVTRPFGLTQFVALKRRLETALKKPVDIVEYAAIKPEIKNAILKEAATIYE